MGALGQLKEELEGLADDLERVCHVQDVVLQPEVARARALVEQARAAVAAAFLSRRAFVLAREAVAEVQDAVTDAMEASHLLRERSAALRSEAAEIRDVTAGVRGIATLLSQWSAATSAVDGSLGEVVVESAIPEGHPEKRSIEDGIRGVLARAGGRWRVWITVPGNAAWWGLRVRGPAIDWVATLQGAPEQTTAVIVERMVPLAQIALAETRYRRSLRSQRSRTPDPGGAGGTGSSEG